MADAAKAAVPGGDLGLQHFRDPVPEPQIGMADDSMAEPHRPVLAARAHRCRPIDELGFSDGLLSVGPSARLAGRRSWRWRKERIARLGRRMVGASS
jgi:hypothetical protein